MSQLAKQINAMMASAYRQRMDIQTITLSRGLTISVYVDDAHRIHLLLSRPDTFPSHAEWIAVLMSLPKVFDGYPEPVQRWSEQARALAAVIPTVRLDPFNQATEQQSERTQP